MINPTDIDDYQTITLVPPGGKCFSFSYKTSHVPGGLVKIFGMHIHDPYKMNPVSSATMRLTFVFLSELSTNSGWICMEICTHIPILSSFRLAYRFILCD